MHTTPILVGIAGPSGAGKSTICKRAEAEYRGLSRFKFDDYYVSAAEVETHPTGYQYWDHPSSIKWDAMVSALTALKAGKSAHVPHYSKAEDRMVGTKIARPTPVILVDGIQLLWDERIRNLLDVAIYLELDELTQVDRRIERQPDVNRDYLWRVMIPANRAYLEPTRKWASHVVDASRAPDKVYQQVMVHARPYFAKMHVSYATDFHTTQKR